MEFDGLARMALSAAGERADFAKPVGQCPHCGKMLGAMVGHYASIGSDDENISPGDFVFCASCAGESVYHGPDSPLVATTDEDYDAAEQKPEYDPDILALVRGAIRMNSERATHKLNAQAVSDVAHYCQLDQLETEEGAIFVDGMSGRWCFSAGRIKEKADEIEAFLLELPTTFRSESGGGWSFLEACRDIRGNEWTARRINIEELFALGIAAGRAQWLGDPDVWHAMPNGVPYVVVIC